MVPYSLCLAATVNSGFLVILISVVGIVLVFAVTMGIFLNRYTRVGPNQVLIVSGRKVRFVGADGNVYERGFRFVKGGGTFVFPIIEKVDILSLEVIGFDLPVKRIATKQGGAVDVDAVAQIKVMGDDLSIARAAEQILGKSIDELKQIGRQAIEGRLRTIVSTLATDEISQGRESLATKTQAAAADDLAKMGLGVVTFTIQNIRT